MGKFPHAHTRKLGLGQNAAWDTSLWFWLMEQGHQGYGEAYETFSSSSLLERLGLGSNLPPLPKQQPERHNGIQVGSGLSQPPLGSPHMAGLCGHRTGGMLSSGPPGWSHLGQAQHVEPHR